MARGGIWELRDSMTRNPGLGGSGEGQAEDPCILEGYPYDFAVDL